MESGRQLGRPKITRPENPINGMVSSCRPGTRPDEEGMGETRRARHPEVTRPVRVLETPFRYFEFLGRYLETRMWKICRLSLGVATWSVTIPPGSTPAMIRRTSDISSTDTRLISRIFHPGASPRRAAGPFT